MIKKRIQSLYILLFRDYRVICFIWIVAAALCGLLKYLRGSYNNYEIFKNVFWHSIHQLPLYNAYPSEYFDLNHYGVFFSALIAPFAVLPNYLGVVLWVTANAWLLMYAIRKLPLSKRQHLLVFLFCIMELFNSLSSQQFNVGIAGIIILSYHLVENKKDFWAAFFIMLGTFTKIYGIVGLAFFPFSRNKVRFLYSCLFWAVVMYLFPMIYTSADYVNTQYYAWFTDLASKGSANMFALMQNISLLGFVRKISGASEYSDLWLIIPGMILFALPYLRFKQYRAQRFRLMLLASVLLFVVLFSTGSESSSYIIAFVGIALWYAKTGTETTKLNLFLLILAFILTGMSSSDLFPSYVRHQFIIPYSLKALPCILIWFKITYELCFFDFCRKEGIPVGEKSAPMLPTQNNEIDLILPCYNPPVGWQDTISYHIEKLNEFVPDKLFHLIVVNDGSTINMTEEDQALFRNKLPNAQLISYTENQGKGYAVRKGMEAACSSLIVYTDWDFPYDNASIRAVISKLEKGYDVVVAARTNSYRQHADLNAFRSLMSVSSRLLNRLALGMKFNDAQGGLKGMNRKGKGIFLRTQINQFLFDTEFVYLASRERDLHICEVTANIREGVHLSAMGLKVLRKELPNFIRIAYR